MVSRGCWERSGRGDALDSGGEFGGYFGCEFVGRGNVFFSAHIVIVKSIIEAVYNFKTIRLLPNK